MKLRQAPRPELWLYPERGLVVEAYRKGRAKPDGMLAPEGQFKGQGTWADPEGVLLVVEVTSADADADQRDRLEKPSGYATAGIPVYLLVDRERQTLVVHSDPDRVAGRYRDTHTAVFGEDVPLPAPVGLTLDTTVLKTGAF